MILWRHLAAKYINYSSGALPFPLSTRKFNRWMRNDINQLPYLLFYPRKPVRYQEGHRLPVGMAMSTFQKVTLATCLMLCVALLLPKMLLSRGRKDAAERPEGASSLYLFISVEISSARCTVAFLL